MPIWRTEDGKESTIIGSVEELVEAIEKSIAAGLMKENPFKDFEVGNMSEENYDQIDLLKTPLTPLYCVVARAMYRESDLIDVT